MRATPSPGERPASGTSRPVARRAAVVAAAAGGMYAVLTVLVATGLADPLDASARQYFRPDDVWGAIQLRADVVVEGLRPTRVALALPVVAGVTAAVRRSWRPLWVALLVGVTSVGLVLLSQLVVARPDTHGVVGTHGGSYPSGHVAILLAVLGGCLLVVETTAWWWAVVVLLDLLMGWCLMLQAAHWLTDVVGGALLGTCVLATVAFVSAREPRRPVAIRRSRPPP